MATQCQILSVHQQCYSQELLLLRKIFFVIVTLTYFEAKSGQTQIWFGDSFDLHSGEMHDHSRYWWLVTGLLAGRWNCWYATLCWFSTFCHWATPSVATLDSGLNPPASANTPWSWAVVCGGVWNSWGRPGSQWSLDSWVWERRHATSGLSPCFSRCCLGRVVTHLT